MLQARDEVRVKSVDRVSSVAKYSPDINDVSTKAEKSPPLRSVTGKRLVTQTEKT
jgi:hypothetical protein